MAPQPPAPELMGREDAKGRENGAAQTGEGRHVNCGCIDSVGEFVSGGIERFFQRTGSFIGNRPWWLMLASIVVLVICLVGLTQFEEENRGEKLWVPGGTQAQEDKDFVEDNYLKFARFQQVLLSRIPRGDNVLTREAFDKLLELHNKVIAVEAENPLAKDNNTEVATLTYENLCFQRGGQCFQVNILASFDFSAENWSDTPTILDRLNSGNLTTATGEPFEVRQALGGIEEDANGNILSAKALAISYYIQNNEIIKDNDYDDPKGEAWEEEFLDLLEDEAKAAELENFAMDRFATRSFEDEFGDAISGDLVILNVAIILLLTYTVVMLSRWSKGCVGSRIFLAVGGFISIGMAIGAALGLGSGLGLFYSPLMSVFPFLILGIGVDDVFVLVNAFDQTSKEFPVAMRISKALGVSGSSIVVTSITDFFAFLIGSNTSLPALRNFSLYAAMGVFITLVFQVTFFAGWLVLDAWRMNSNRADVVMCIKFDEDGGKCCDCNNYNDNLLTLILNRIARFMSKTPVKVIVILTFVGVAAGGLAGIVNIEVDADVDDFIPTGSYLRDWNTIREDYFTTVGSSTGIYMQDVEFSSEQIQRQMTQMCEAFQSNPTVVDSTVRCWYEDFRAFVSPGVEAILENGTFYESLGDWLNGAGGNFRNDVILNEDGRIVTSRFTGNHIFSDKSNDLVNFMDSLRDTVKNFEAPLGPNSFAYGGDYIQIEQYKAIGKEALVNIGLALLMVFIITFLLLVNPFGAILTFLSIALVVVELVGYMHWWGFNIDNVVVIFLVISLGLSVDYSAHIAHAFLVATGSPNDRMVKALTEMGPAVVNGATSTFIAVLALGTANSYVFETFFSALFLTVILGMGHGMILLPVALSIFAPKSHRKFEEAQKSPATEMQPKQDLREPAGPNAV